MHYYYDSEVFNLSYQQFMVGTELMVAPVLERSKSETSIYLPAGNWVDLWTGEVRSSSGQSFLITGLTDRPAVFFPQGSAVGAQFRSNLISAGLL
jgi:alpha-glucosidase (family GH31 glycosyl hydrolase)